jgi:hypothetical protein
MRLQLGDRLQLLMFRPLVSSLDYWHNGCFAEIFLIQGRSIGRFPGYPGIPSMSVVR